MKFRNLIISTIGLLSLWQWQRQREYANATPIKNKVVIITGASSGIGRAAAYAFAAQGAHTVLVARRASTLAEMQSDLQAQFSTKVLTIPADLTRDADIKTVVTETIKTFGRIDVLVNNAGLTMGGKLEEQDPAAIHTMIDLNLYSAIRLTHAVLPCMKSQYSGHIINVSSVAGTTFAPGQETYAATKSGLNGFSIGLRREVANHGIYVSVIQPGWTETPMIGRANRQHMQAAGVLPPLVEIQSPEYVASHIVAAVRYHKRRVILGGLGFVIITLLDQHVPWLVDWWYPRLYDYDKIVDLMSETG